MASPSRGKHTELIYKVSGRAFQNKMLNVTGLFLFFWFLFFFFKDLNTLCHCFLCYVMSPSIKWYRLTHLMVVIIKYSDTLMIIKHQTMLFDYILIISLGMVQSIMSRCSFVIFFLSVCSKLYSKSRFKMFIVALEVTK